jgi:hypothetical protein
VCQLSSVIPGLVPGIPPDRGMLEYDNYFSAHTSSAGILRLRLSPSRRMTHDEFRTYLRRRENFFLAKNFSLRARDFAV